jgi:hypothetical protein
MLGISPPWIKRFKTFFILEKELIKFILSMLEGMDWMYLAQDKDLQCGNVNTVRVKNDKTHGMRMTLQT